MSAPRGLLRDVPEPERRALGPIGLGYLAYNEGRLDDADAIYGDVALLSPIGQGLVRWETEWIETLTRAGRRAEALALLDALEAEVAGELLTLAGIERAKGMLALDDDEAAAWFVIAVDAGVRHGDRFSEGRAELLWGERLRRVRRRAEARTHLERAVELFRGVGATLFAERAATELRASGGVMGADVASHQLLTPHELQVARLVVGGASNRELAATLFISPRTVEAHLTSIFRKLGVRNRRELAARALNDAVLQPA